MSDVRVLLADDHAMFRSGVAAMIEASPGLSVVGHAAGGWDAVRLAAALRPDVVVMDLAMPDLDGIAATQRIAAEVPAVRVVCLTGRSDERTIRQAISAGAVGVVSKVAAFEEVATAVRAAAGGQRYVSPSLRALAARPDTDGTGVPRLSGREREVLHLIAGGRATKEAAADLHVSVKTVETHRANLMNKTGLSSVAELTKYAVRHGLAAL